MTPRTAEKNADEMERLRQRVAELEAKLEESKGADQDEDVKDDDEDTEFDEETFNRGDYGDGGYDSPNEYNEQSLNSENGQQGGLDGKEGEVYGEDSGDYADNQQQGDIADEDGTGGDAGADTDTDTLGDRPDGAQSSARGDTIGRVPSGAEVLGVPVPALKDVPASLQKICANLHATTEKSKWVVIVSCGAYNPVHLMHLRAFYIARQFFAHHTDYRVIGGIMSPSHDTLVRHKTRRVPKEMCPTRHRLGMCQSAAKGSSWIAVDRWEVTRRRIMDYLSTLAHVQSSLEEHLPGHLFRVVYLCGGNHLLQLSPQAMKDMGYGCIAVCRPGQTEELLKQIPTAWTGLAHLVEDTAVLPRELEGTSSVRVRNDMKARKDVKSKVGVNVLKYMQQNRIADKIAGRMQWTDTDKTLRAEDKAYQDATINDGDPKQKARRDSVGKLPQAQHNRAKERNSKEVKTTTTIQQLQVQVQLQPAPPAGVSAGSSQMNLNLSSNGYINQRGT